MAKIPVIQYGVEWNPGTNQGSVYTLFQNGQKGKVPVESAQEMVIVLMMLNKCPVLFDDQTRELEVPWRSTGT